MDRGLSCIGVKYNMHTESTDVLIKVTVHYDLMFQGKIKSECSITFCPDTFGFHNPYDEHKMKDMWLPYSGIHE